jgi:hypothetical protein
MRTSHIILVLAGCGVDTSPPVVTPPIRFVTYESVCRHIECANSPEVARYGMHDANLFGVPDDNGIHLETGKSGRAVIWSDAGDAYDLHVENDRLFGVRGATTLKNHGLKGAYMIVWKDGTPIYKIRIEAPPRLIPMAQDNEQVEVYKMKWHPLAGDWRPAQELCNVPVYPLRKDDMDGMESEEVLVVVGDRIRRHEKTMSTDEEWDRDWFNFGCAGRTIAKLKLTRNTTKSQLTPSHPRRQATLKMLAGDYIGDGRPYTVTGAPILWNDNSYIHYAGYTPTEIESRWTANGAMCINGLRLQRTSLPGHATILEELYDHGLLMNCLDPMLFVQGLDNFSDGAQVISAFHP